MFVLRLLFLLHCFPVSSIPPNPPKSSRPKLFSLEPGKSIHQDNLICKSSFANLELNLALNLTRSSNGYPQVRRSVATPLRYPIVLHDCSSWFDEDTV